MIGVYLSSRLLSGTGDAWEVEEKKGPGLAGREESGAWMAAIPELGKAGKHKEGPPFEKHKG